MNEIHVPEVETLSSEKIEKEIFVEDIPGVGQVPYKAMDKVTVVLEDGTTEEKPIQPPYIRHLRNGNYPAAYNSINKEIIMEINRAKAFHADGYEGPVAVSAAVPAGTFVMSRDGRIILNEAEALDRAIDSDGDRAVLLPDESFKIASLVKWPITRTVPNIFQMPYIPAEKFFDFTEHDWNRIQDEKPIQEYDLKELFMKAHMDVPIGRLTSAHNAKALYEATQKKLPYTAIGEMLMADPQRFIDIEKAGIKEQTKGTTSGTARSNILDYPRTLDVRSAPFLTSVSNVGTKTAEQVSFIVDEDLPKLVDDIMNLRVGFRPVKKVTHGVTEVVKPRIHDGRLISRLLDPNIGVLRFEEFKHDHPLLAQCPACMVWIQRPNGKLLDLGYKDANGRPIYVADGNPVALTDVKRESGLSAGLTYAFILPPVYDPERDEFMHPLNHMAKIMAEFPYSEIRVPGSRHVVGMFPRNVEDLSKYETKTAMLVKAISDYCSKYGDPVPAEWINSKQFRPSTMAISVACKSVIIDYMRDRSNTEMFPIFERANSKIKLCSAKGKDRRVRKYLLAKENGVPVYSPKSCNPKRCGAQRAQLIRVVKECKMRVAVVAMETQTQVLITPSGIKKQITDKIFLPEVSNVEDPHYPDAHDYETLSGEKRRCWTRSARDTIRIGKLIDLLGNKVMPREFRQVYDKDDNPIDLLFPYHELVNKDAHHAFMKNGEWQEITIHVEDEGGLIKTAQTYKVMAYVVERTFYRTGAASENVKARFRRVQYKNVDAEAIMAAYRQIRNFERGKPDLKFAIQLQKVARRIRDLFPVSA